jgi:glycosyltransferase involved in cell wall biosynthesis
MSQSKKVLFLGHDASRTGAPLVLLEVIKWLKDHSSIQPHLLLKQGGSIGSTYEDICPVRYLAKEFDHLNGGLIRRGLRKLRLATVRQPEVASLYPAAEFPVVYANTVVTCDLAMQFAGPGRRIIQHIHELAYSTQYFNLVDALKRSVPSTFAYIAVSDSVREYLVKTIGVPPEKIRVIHGFPIVPPGKKIAGPARSKLLEQLGIPNGSFVIGMCGLPQWRKGADLFVQLALHVRRQLEPAACHFVWLGGDANSQREALYDVAQTGLQGLCHFIPAVSEPETYYAAFDLFALTSREDPFSVAMLEAAANGLPVVSFANAGGATELVENDAGIIVPYLDVPAMARACVELLTDERRRMQLGAAAKAKVEERYLLALQAPKMLAVIESAMA